MKPTPNIGSESAVASSWKAVFDGLAPIAREADPGEGTSSPPSFVYRAVARLCLPRWIHRLDFDLVDVGDPRRARRKPFDTSALYHQQLAALAVGLVCEFDGEYADDTHLREGVRTSLIRWQLGLRADGRPIHRRLRNDPHHAAIAAALIQLVTDTTGFQTETLLQDIERHLHWLLKQPSQTARQETAIIGALADGAILVRDNALLAKARNRLDALLRCQDDEGWFPARQGPDVGILSTTVDALARVYHGHGWPELYDPLKRVLRFLLHFVHPDGTFGGCNTSPRETFLSPYGVELLAAAIPEAASLALLARNQCERAVIHGMSTWPDDRCAAWGSRIALAAAHASADLSAAGQYPCDTLGVTQLPSAGFVIFSTETYYAVTSARSGGALRVTWRTGKPPLEDAGVMAVFPHGIYTSRRWNQNTRYRVTESTLTIGSFLQPEAARSNSGPRRLHSWISWITRYLKSRTTRFDFPMRLRWLRPATRRRGRWRGVRYRREISFAKNSVQVRDVILCRRPCQAVVCQLPSSALSNTGFDPVTSVHHLRAPIFVEGGRKVEITRRY